MSKAPLKVESSAWRHRQPACRLSQSRRACRAGRGLRPHKERADKAAERLGVPAYQPGKLKAHPDLDIVDGTSGYENGSWHYEPTMEALDAGKHVLVEKPISNEITEAREMVAYAYKKGLYLGCNLNHYFSLPAERAKKYMDEGQIGEQVYCINKVGFNGSEAGYGGTGAPLERPYCMQRRF